MFHIKLLFTQRIFQFTLVISYFIQTVSSMNLSSQHEESVENDSKAKQQEIVQKEPYFTLSWENANPTIPTQLSSIKIRHPSKEIDLKNQVVSPGDLDKRFISEKPQEPLLNALLTQQINSNPTIFSLNHFNSQFSSFNTSKKHQPIRNQLFRSNKNDLEFINIGIPNRDKKFQTIEDSRVLDLNYISGFTRPSQVTEINEGSLMNFVQDQKIDDDSASRFLPPEQNNDHQQSIKLNIRSQLIRKSRKYQISTNNAHKKYINCLKNLFYEALTQQQIMEFQRKYIKQKSSRVFFFIILVYVKYRFSEELGLAVKLGFQKQMNERIKEYEEQIYRCSDFMLKNYRYEEIHQIQIALKAIEEFYLGNTAYAIEYLYRKDKHIIVKQNHFRTSLKIIQDLETQYSAVQGLKISKPVYKDHYHKKNTYKLLQKPEKDLKQAFQKESLIEKPSMENMQEIHNLRQMKESQIPSVVQIQNQNRIPLTNKTYENNSQKSNLIQIQFSDNYPVIQQNIEHLSAQGNLSHYESQIEEEQLEQSQQQSSRHGEMQNINQKVNPVNEPQIEEQERSQLLMEETLFPPIPPYFYLSDFDHKYGYLFRKLQYIRSWREMSQNESGFESNSMRKPQKGGNMKHVPSPLVFGNRSFLPRRVN